MSRIEVAVGISLIASLIIAQKAAKQKIVGLHVSRQLTTVFIIGEMP
jgi:hypothetical protein